MNNGKTSAEQYLQQQIRIQLDELKPTKFQKSIVPAHSARQLSVEERVQARYYANNRKQWKLETIKKIRSTPLSGRTRRWVQI